VDEARTRLEEERRRTQARVHDLVADFDGVVAASRDTNADDEHDPEGTTIAFERAALAALLRQARDHLREVDLALDRVADGTYGRCLSCGGPVGAARLEARPVARTCIACAASS
jgi:DnaK suppressor protein